MRDFVYMVGAHEYPDTLNDDCSSFVYNFISKYQKEGYIDGPLENLRELLCKY
ncbi:hypothetical protein EYZ11_011740 [Aspergillus tanneri]|uniref:Uncharacterized protein n=1 Tax=Aspergillus tanneri TaxID=1220188 RepID=A0A4S3J2L1_9EURO|nr:hypothetical protein EYZ11_011740 [Aspergillus tanneri]